MPMFETPKPKQFRYKPRFYDPEKERWEALKQKYADQRLINSELGELDSELTDESDNSELSTPNSEIDKELAYFQQRVRELDREKRSKLTWKDMFRKREMPKFNYQPRFSSGSGVQSQELTDASTNPGLAEHLSEFKRRGIKIKRRFGNEDPGDNTLKPVPAGRIMLYALLATLLIYWIIK